MAAVSPAPVIRSLVTTPAARPLDQTCRWCLTMLGHHNIHFLLHLPLTLKIYLKTVTYTYMFEFKCVLKQIFFTVIVKLWCFVIKFLCSSGLLWVLYSPFQALSHRLHVWTIPARHNVIMYHFLNYISTLMPWLCSHPTTHHRHRQVLSASAFCLEQRTPAERSENLLRRAGNKGSQWFYKHGEGTY